MTDAFAQSTLHAATLRIQGAVSATADRLTETLALGTPPPGSSRQALTALQLELRRKLPGFNLEFANALREKIQAETLPRSDSGRGGLSTTSWESLTLVDDAEVDERVSAERLSMEIAHECEWELRELDGYVGAILSGKPDPERNPLRTEGVATALVRAIKLVSPEAEDRKLLVREFGRALAPAMRSCYAEIVAELRAKGVRAATLAVRTTQGPGNDLPREVLRENSGYQTSGFRSSGFGTGHGAGPGSGHTPLGGPASGSTPFPGSTPGSAPGSYSQAVGGADVQMLEMLRRIANLIPDTGFAPTEVQVGGPAPSGPAALGVAGGLRTAAPVNLIRQHREELVRASGGALDHMVIDVVGAMFDHLLADAKVPPQLARQIARLQMPVLRAALKDMDFFSSRRHPVRRFVNRIASLAAAYEDLEQGPGRDFIERVRALVQEIVEGDFDQMDLYESKLQAIEALIHEQSARDVGTHATAAALLDGKETQLRIQQRFMMQLRAGLEPLALPDYLRDFLSQVWSQVQVQVAGPGHDPELVMRMGRTVRELVLSIQPKGEPALRKAFLLTLPQLMKDLNEGLALIRWPEAAKKEFFGKLLPAHAGSLKTPPPTDFEQRQLKFKLEQLGKIAIPTAQDLGPSSAPAPLPKADEHAAPLQFSDEEAQRIGLVEESAVDWDGVVDIDLDEPAAPASDTDPGAIAGESTSEVDIQVEPAPDAPPTHGPQLIHYLQPGIAYRMHLEGRWQRVRLNWVSPGRAFFVFTHGKAHEKTLSMTARMLTRLCETERIRTFEQAELIERATARARKQLAQLTAASRHGALGARS